MRRALFTGLFLCLFGFQAVAQDGNPFITNYELTNTIVDNQNWSVTQDNDEVMLFANRRGILAFDGVQWQLIPTNDFPHIVKKEPQSGTILVGCKNGFGYLSKNDQGQTFYTPVVHSNEELGDITNIEITSSHAYFCSSKAVSELRLSDLSVSGQWNCKTNEPYTGFMLFNNKLHVNIDTLGMHQLIGAQMQAIKNGQQTAGLEVLFSIKYDDRHTLIGLDDNSLYLFDGEHFNPFGMEAQRYIEEGVLAGGAVLPNNKIALSTLSGGVVIIDKSTHQTSYTLNYQTGLPDDEIFAMGIDAIGGLWLCHEFGISRVDLSLPIRSYDSYPGLEGNLISCIEFDSTLYVTTSEGLFYLEEVRGYEELEVLVKKRVERAEPTIPEEVVTEDELPTESETTAQDTATEMNWQEKWRQRREDRKKKRRNKRKKQGDDEEETTSDPVVESDTTASQSTTDIVDKDPVLPAVQPTTSQADWETEAETIVTSKTIYALQSISHIFKKVEGLDKKCKQEMLFHDRLLVATNTGLYEVKDKQANLIVDGRYINFMTKSRQPNRIYVGTASGLFVATFENEVWEQHNTFGNFEESVYSIVEDDPNHLWLGSENNAYYVTIDDNGAPRSEFTTYGFDNDYSEQVLIRKVYGQTFFFMSSGIYNYNDSTDKIEYSTALNRNFMPNSKFIISQENITWIYNTVDWISLYDHNADLNPAKKVYLDLFDDVKNIYVDSDRNMWVIERNRGLFKILSSDQHEQQHPFNIYIRAVLSDTGYNYSLSELKLGAEDNSLTFNIAAPYYVKLNSVEYQYYVEGLMRDWGRWTTSASIDLPYVPDGEFILHVRARNVLGQVTNEKSLPFSVAPTIWDSVWFRVGYIILGILGLWFIFLLRTRALQRQRRILEQRVKVRTVQLQEQKDKAEDLLLNILPVSVAQELTMHGKSTPKYYNMATVLFTDFKGFTKISEALPPEELVKTLDACFGRFDDIVTKWGIEKIKTIGDAYMCAGGLPVQNEYHPILVTLAAMEVRDFMEEFKQERANNGEPEWELRLGINSGSLIAGVVGKKKFAYDVWGDTVNTAARLESASEPGKINISGTTYEYIKRYFDCTQRGKVEVKNKGKIDMYFVDGIKPEYSADGAGRVPNDKFIKILGMDRMIRV